jgi:hypothetical protein
MAGGLHEIVRQQWNFSPEGATAEREDYRVALTEVTILELSIIPDITGGGKADGLLSRFCSTPPGAVIG